MRRAIAVLAVALLLGAAPEASGESAAALSSDTVEQVDVRLTILDVFVQDKRGNPVPDLTIDEFELIADGKLVPLDTLDNACVRSEERRDRTLLAVRDVEPEPPKLVLAFDYLHLDRIQRVEAIEQVLAMVRQEAIEGYRLMLVALTGGVRIEQSFTDDRDAVQTSLTRMQNDPTLSVPEFYHQNSFIFIDGLTALFDVLGSEPGNKAVVLFSAMRDVPFDSQFRRIAAIAASSRSSIYPVDVRGLMTPTLFEEDLDDLKSAVRTRLDTAPNRDPLGLSRRNGDQPNALAPPEAAPG